jgi:hypothetical protein
MKGATLIALLPLLATISAHPQPDRLSHSHLAQQKKDVRVSRKSIGFGPELTHSTFRAFHPVDVKEVPLNVGENIIGLARGDVFPVVKHLMSTLDGVKGEGEGYFIRDDVSCSSDLDQTMTRTLTCPPRPRPRSTIVLYRRTNRNQPHLYQTDRQRARSRQR